MKSISILFSIFLLLGALSIQSCGDSDDTPPIITLSSAQNITIPAGGIVPIVGQVTDNEELSSIRITSTGAVSIDQGISPLDSQTSHALNINVTIADGTPDGNYAFTVTATDKEGNSSNEDVNFTIEN